jgi:hypothetical protein
MMKFVFSLSAFGLLAGAGTSDSLAAFAGQASVFQEILSVPLADNQAAFVYLGYSAIIVRTTKSAVIIDPAALLLEQDMDAFQGKSVDAVLFTHGSDAQYQEFKKKTQMAMPGMEVIIPETIKVYTVKLS